MKTLGSLKIDEKSYNNMIASIKKYNNKNTFSVSQAEYRRFALELLNQIILKDIPIPIKIQSNFL